MSNETMNATESQNEVATGNRKLAGKYLTFFLANEQYGLQILKVREIIGLMKICPIPNAPKCIRGVLNLRGKIVSVMDLREKLSLDVAEKDRKTCIIVTETESEDGVVEMGLLVDAVSEVIDIDESEIEPPPMLGGGVHVNCILGMAQSGQNVKILLDLEQIIRDLSVNELDLSELATA